MTLTQAQQQTGEIHTDTAQMLEHVFQTVALGNWQGYDRSAVEQSVEKLLQIKALYLYAHPLIDDNPVIVMLDETLISLYRCLDTLDGHDIFQRSDLYHALAQAQHPLLKLKNLLPTTVQESVLAQPVLVEAAHLEEARLTHEDAVSPEKISSGQASFRWSASMVAQLRTAYVACTQLTAAARIQEIAERFTWPEASVTYKVYALKLQEMHAPAHKREASDAQETEAD